VPKLIEDYALLGDTHSAALVARDGSIDWWCTPRFDSSACFAALLGSAENGRWLLAPAGEVTNVERRYRGDTLVLETEFRTPGGTARVVDCMPPRGQRPDIVRIVEGVAGAVDMEMELVVRFDYGAVIPWVERVDGALRAIAGPDALVLRSPVHTHGEDFTTVASFRVAAGERVPFALTWYPSHEQPPSATDPFDEVERAMKFWTDWVGRCGYDGEWREAVVRSLLTLKALTFAPTGGIVAAVTTSLPEKIGGVRNWDYRYCWLRDATFTLYALMMGGYDDEARAWREWLLRAVAGTPGSLQIMYGPGGERRLTECEIDWLPGYEGSTPVRIGNAASGQLQLDVFGEVMDAMYQAERVGLPERERGWDLQVALMEYLESNWQEPDDGIWEIRGDRRRFTHSQMMTWVAADRAVRSIEELDRDGPLGKWRALRDTIHDDVCANGFNAERNSFTQSYGSSGLDASLLMMPLVGFLPFDDPRIVGTVAAIERELMVDGLVQRYTSDTGVDGLPEGEGAFLACSFWLADYYALAGRDGEARALFERLCALRNDVGLLAEEYDPVAKRQLGNFPQALSHIPLVNTALNLGGIDSPARHRLHRNSRHSADHHEKRPARTD
jgi:GH15 family glucan-1,4-alpha-glucosidase